MKKGLFLVMVILAGIVLVLWNSVRQTRRENIRLTANQEVLLSNIRYYKTSDSLNVASVNALTLKNREFQRYNAGLKKVVNSLKLQVKRLQSVSQTATETRYAIKNIVRDSILPGRTDTLKCLNYWDPYLTFSGCMDNRLFSGIIESRDTLLQIVHRVPRKFWFIRWGTKAIRQEVICRNPYSRVTYTEYIELKK